MNKVLSDIVGAFVDGANVMIMMAVVKKEDFVDEETGYYHAHGYPVEVLSKEDPLYNSVVKKFKLEISG